MEKFDVKNMTLIKGTAPQDLPKGIVFDKVFIGGSGGNLEKIVEALRWAPSVKNSQPWILYNNSNMVHLYEEKQKKNISSD